MPHQEKTEESLRTWRTGQRDRDSSAEPGMMLPSKIGVINETPTLDEAAVFNCDQRDICILAPPLWLIRTRAAALIL